MILKLTSSVLFLLILLGCSDNSTTESQSASISGTVKFINGTPAVDAQIRLIVVESNQNKFTTTDQNGRYSFDDLPTSVYEISFISPTYEINSYRSDEISLSGSNVVHDVKITYHILDELKSKVVSDSLFLIQFQPDGAMIGSNYSAVQRMTGFYRPTNGAEITLTCDVYKLPVNYNWNEAESLTPTYVKENFSYLMSLTESSTNFNHSVEVSGEKIEKILSNPVNGFVFIKSTDNSKELKIPCVDFNNNDFGFIINYN